ncbi:hypothetical protein D3C73_1628060 [compost metagenome]
MLVGGQRYFIIVNNDNEFFLWIVLSAVIVEQVFQITLAVRAGDNGAFLQNFVCQLPLHHSLICVHLYDLHLKYVNGRQG